MQVFLKLKTWAFNIHHTSIRFLANFTNFRCRSIGPFIPAKSVGIFFAGDAHGGWGSLEAGLQLGFCHPNIMGLLCFSEVCRIRHRTIHRWMKDFMIWSDFTSWEFETPQKSEQNVSMGRILYRGLVAFLSKAKFTVDVADPALCMTDSTSVIYLFLHVVWTQRLSNESASDMEIVAFITPFDIEFEQFVLKVTCRMFCWVRFGRLCLCQKTGSKKPVADKDEYIGISNPQWHIRIMAHTVSWRKNRIKK